MVIPSLTLSSFIMLIVVLSQPAVFALLFNCVTKARIPLVEPSYLFRNGAVIVWYTNWFSLFERSNTVFILHCAGVNEKVDIVLVGELLGGLRLVVVRGFVRTGLERRVGGRCLIFACLIQLDAVVIANRLLLRAEVA